MRQSRSFPIFQRIQIGTHGGLEPQVQGVRNERMPDAHLQHMRHVGDEIGQIGTVEVVSRIHPQAHAPGKGRRPGEGQRRLGPHGPVRHGIRFGVQLDAVCARGLRRHQVVRNRLHEETGSDAGPSKLLHHGRQRIHARPRLPSRLAGQRIRRVRHQGDLLRHHLQHQVQEIWTGVALDIELRVHHPAQRPNIRVRDVPGVRPRVDRDAVRAPLLDAHRGEDDIGHRTAPRIPQRSHLVHIDAESSHPYLSETFGAGSSAFEGQIYAMHAQRLMTQDLPAVKPSDTVDQVLAMMDSFKVRHLPLVDGEQWIGLLYEDILLEADGDAAIGTLHGATAVQVAPHAHLYDLVAQFVRAEVDVLAVVRDGLFLGSIRRGQILKFLAEDAAWAHPGGTVVIEVPEADLSLSEMARLVELEGARILAYTVAPDPSTGHLEVTFKLNTQDVEPVLSTLQRFGYNIQTFFHSPELEEEMRSRFEAFMRYLDL